MLGLVLGLIILGTLSRYYCAHSITPCFNRSVGTITTAYLLVFVIIRGVLRPLCTLRLYVMYVM